MAHTRKSISTIEFEITITERALAHVGAEECGEWIEEARADLADLKAALVVVKERRAKKLAKEAATVWAAYRATKSA